MRKTLRVIKSVCLEKLQDFVDSQNIHAKPEADYLKRRSELQEMLGNQQGNLKAEEFARKLLEEFFISWENSVYQPPHFDHDPSVEEIAYEKEYQAEARKAYQDHLDKADMLYYFLVRKVPPKSEI